MRLAASATFYTVARALRIKSIKELLVPAQISPDKELWVLGERYAPGGDQDAVQKVRPFALFEKSRTTLPWYRLVLTEFCA